MGSVSPRFSNQGRAPPRHLQNHLWGHPNLRTTRTSSTVPLHSLQVLPPNHPKTRSLKPRSIRCCLVDAGDVFRCVFRGFREVVLGSSSFSPPLFLSPCQTPWESTSTPSVCVCVCVCVCPSGPPKTTPKTTLKHPTPRTTRTSSTVSLHSLQVLRREHSCSSQAPLDLGLYK